MPNQKQKSKNYLMAAGFIYSLPPAAVNSGASSIALKVLRSDLPLKLIPKFHSLMRDAGGMMPVSLLQTELILSRL
jgi:hypothetical protein